jgi:poly(3-hydroxybutyrate) depolymerase
LIPGGGGYDWNVPGEPLVGGQYPPAGAAIITAVLGPQSDAVDANSTMWAFFQAHPLP